MRSLLGLLGIAEGTQSEDLAKLFVAGETSLKFGAEKESPRQLAVQRITLLRRWSQSLLQHQRDQILYSARCQILGLVLEIDCLFV